MLVLRRASDLAGIQRNPGKKFVFSKKTYRLKDVFDSMENQDAAEGVAMRRRRKALLRVVLLPPLRGGGDVVLCRCWHDRG